MFFLCYLKHHPYHVIPTCMLSCFSLTFCDPTDCSPSGSSDHGILQARILEWVAMPSSRGSSRPRDRTWVSYMSLHWQAGSLPLVPPGKPSIILAPLYNLWRRGSQQRGEGGYNGSSSSPSFLFAQFCAPLTLKEHNKEYDH